MAYGGTNFPNLKTVLDNGNDVGSGNAIAFSNTLAMSGIDKGIGFVQENGTRVAAINSPKDDLASPTFAFESDRTGFLSEASEAAVTTVQNAQRREYIGDGLSHEFQVVSNFRLAVYNLTANSIPIGQTTTGGMFTNVGATALLIAELPGGPSGGNVFEFYNSSPTFAFRVRPNALNQIITPTGILPSGNYVDLAYGACIRLMVNNDMNWMTVIQTGAVTPQP